MQLFFLFALLVSIAIAQSQYPVKHVIALMEENRSFDHLMGYMKTSNPEIRGLTGKEYNLANTSDPNSSKTYVNDKADYICPYDPDHSWGGTKVEIFGNGAEQSPAPMNGFAQDHIRLHHDPTNVLSMFPPNRVPIITTLAKEFALFDMWFCSVPGPTNPNRWYFHSGTSRGWIGNTIPTAGFPQKTLFDEFEAANLTWKIYYHDSVNALGLANLRKPEMKKHIVPISEYYSDCKEGTLPHYAFIEPRWGSSWFEPANDQHPVHSVAAGELLMKELYEAIRASPQWNESMLVITYDEHGGFYDHMPTPMKGVPNPDGINHQDPFFSFDRLGVRIPTVMISPWINKGTIVHEPSGPTTTSQYDATSMQATLKKMFGLDAFLTKRAEWAGTFESVFTQRSSPRTDCPDKLPPAPTVDIDRIKYEMQQPTNDLQLELCDIFGSVVGEPDLRKQCETMTEHEWSVWMQESLAAWING